MTCPICDEKTINCDCTSRERAMYRELQDLEESHSVVLTDDERAAVTWFAHNGLPERRAATLRGLLARIQ